MLDNRERVDIDAETAGAHGSGASGLRYSLEGLERESPASLYPLFTRVRRRGILGSLHPVSCIENRLKTARLDP
jgi:hypothetical protein